MSDDSGGGIWPITLNLVALGATVAIFVWLAPLFLHAAWQLLPAVLMLWLIITVFRSMISQFLGRK